MKHTISLKVRKWKKEKANLTHVKIVDRNYYLLSLNNQLFLAQFLYIVTSLHPAYTLKITIITLQSFFALFFVVIYKKKKKTLFYC